MRKHATTLIAPLAALAVVGTVGAGTAQANEYGYGYDHGYGGDHEAISVQLETSDEAEAALDQAGASLDAVEPATEAESEDGSTEITFPTSEDQGFTEGQAAFDGGIALTGASGETTWLDPSLDTTDWQVSFDVDGQRVDLLQVVPDDGTAVASDVGGWGHEADLALTAEGAEALNTVVGDGTFAEGDVFGDASPAEESNDSPDWGDKSEPSDQESDHGWDKSGWDRSGHGWGDSDGESDHGWSHSDDGWNDESDHGWGDDSDHEWGESDHSWGDSDHGWGS